jgi:hypothetical protein
MILSNLAHNLHYKLCGSDERQLQDLTKKCFFLRKRQLKYAQDQDMKAQRSKGTMSIYTTHTAIGASYQCPNNNREK